jgi:hypothetical protein
MAAVWEEAGLLAAMPIFGMEIDAGGGVAEHW